MCGIAGIFDPRNKFSLELKQETVSRFCKMQNHRGPDATGLWKSKNCTLGHTRLSIIDLDSRSNQPMLDQCKRFVLSFNGEIYNFPTIKQTLENSGVTFRTHSDTEVLLEGFIQWGEDVFAKLDGMFACAIYDTQLNKICLARDRMGEKPLYYTLQDNVLAFSSELKPLTSMPDISLVVSNASLFEFMALRYVADPNTIFSHIKSLQPGTLITLDGNLKITEKPYFSFDIEDAKTRSQYSLKSYEEMLDEALIASVKTRLVADVPVGAFLSSGVDSSLVCSIAAKKLNSEVKCFSAGFVAGKDNETGNAKKIADYLGLPFEEYLVSPDDMIKTAAGFGSLLDEPNGDRSCVPTYFLSRLIKTQVTVAVSGDGGDELFGGYGRYGPISKEGDLKDHEIDAVYRYLKERLPVFPLTTLSQLLPEELSVFKKRLLSRFTTVFARQDLEDIERLRLIDAHSYLPGAVLSKVDRMSMRHSLEVRTPFFSPDILNLSAKLPMALCANNQHLKVALRNVLSRYLPPDLIRPGKQGFGMPASFFANYTNIFNDLALQSDEILSQWEPFTTNHQVFSQLKTMARSNINSCWAWIVLGQWVESLA